MILLKKQRNSLIGLMISLILPLTVNCQQYDWKRGILRGTTYTIPGISAGLHETILHHYGDFKKKFPKANDRFWDPRISWERKYEMGGIHKTFPIITDAYHLTKAIKTVGLIGSTVYITIGERRPWWHYAIDLGIGMTFYGLGSNLTYEYFKTGR